MQNLDVLSQYLSALARQVSGNDSLKITLGESSLGSFADLNGGRIVLDPEDVKKIKSQESAAFLVSKLAMHFRYNTPSSGGGNKINVNQELQTDLAALSFLFERGVHPAIDEIKNMLREGNEEPTSEELSDTKTRHSALENLAWLQGKRRI